MSPVAKTKSKARKSKAGKAGDYDVGYGKPPKASQFQPGESGNRRGRPKGVRNVDSLLKTALAEKVVVTENGQKLQVSKAEVLFKQLVNKAAGGDVRAAKMVMDLMRGSEADEKLNAPPTVNPDVRNARNALVMQMLREQGKTGGGDDD